MDSIDLYFHKHNNISTLSILNCAILTRDKIWSKERDLFQISISMNNLNTEHKRQKDEASIQSPLFLKYRCRDFREL